MIDKNVSTDYGRSLRNRGYADFVQPLLEEAKIILHPIAALCGKLEYLHAGAHCLNVAIRGLPIEFNRRCQVHFADHRDVGTVEDSWILQWFVFSFRHGDENEAEILAEVIRRRADEVSHIFDKKKIQFVEIPLLERVLDHGCFEMTEGARSDLFYRNLAAG